MYLVGILYRLGLTEIKQYLMKIKFYRLILKQVKDLVHMGFKIPLVDIILSRILVISYAWFL